MALFDAIHSVDRAEPGRGAGEGDRASRAARHLFVQVNTGEEPQKAGVLPQDADAFLEACRETYGSRSTG